MMHLGMDGYTESCLSIVTAAKSLCTSIKTDFPELYILGDPLCSVFAFGSITEGKEGGLAIYEVGDKLGEMGYHLNAIQGPSALHLACTRLTVGVVDELLRDLRLAIDAVRSNGGKGGGSMVMICEESFF